MTTHESSRAVHVLVILVLGIATGGMIAVSLRANFLFGYGFGQTQERAFVFGWANAAADIWKAAGLIVITSLWRAKQKRFAICLTPVWLLCVLWGLAGAIGVYAQDRTALIGTREAKVATYKDAERELAEIEAKLKTLKSERTPAQVDAAITAVLARPIMVGERVRGTVGKLSNNCTKEERLTAEACLEVAQVREERAAAEEGDRLRTRQGQLRLEINRLREGGSSLPADPVAELFAWLSRGQLSVRDIAFGFPLVFAFLIEIVSACGLPGLVAYAEATKRMPDVSASQSDVSRSGTLLPAEAGFAELGRVVKWMAERTEPTGDNAAITIEALHADYEVWCVGKNVSATSAFSEEFDSVRAVPELAGKIRKFGNRYYGIRLVGSNVARIGSRK
jgi:cell division protein FtsB